MIAKHARTVSAGGYTPTQQRIPGTVATMNATAQRRPREQKC